MSAGGETTLEVRGRERWQQRLLPFMMGSILVMGIFFFIASLYQLYYLHHQVAHTRLDLLPHFAQFEEKSSKAIYGDKEYLRWKTLMLLEQDVVHRRYHQANSVMLARVWTRYLGFVTGMILALVGAAFILGKLQELPTKLEADSQLFKASVYTSSPGILLAVLGTILMAITLLVPFEIETRDRATYTGDKVAISDLPPPKKFPESPTYDIKIKEEELFKPIAKPEGGKEGLPGTSSSPK
jgi:hypothetical protein